MPDLGVFGYQQNAVNDDGCEARTMTAVAYIGAALAEIAGCFAFWAWLRLEKSAWWLIPGIAALCLFAHLLTLIDAEHAGRTYAAYGGVYIVSALFWLWFAEGVKPDRWDIPESGHMPDWRRDHLVRTEAQLSWVPFPSGTC